MSRWQAIRRFPWRRLRQWWVWRPFVPLVLAMTALIAVTIELRRAHQPEDLILMMIAYVSLIAAMFTNSDDWRTYDPARRFLQRWRRKK